MCTTNGSVCFLCEYSYALVSANTVCDLCSDYLENCVHCSVVTVCEVCAIGFFVEVSSGECALCMYGCYDCFDSSTCEMCLATHALVGGVCYLCEDAMTGCSLCTSLSICTAC